MQPDLEPRRVERAPNNDREYYLFALRIVGDFGVSLAIPVIGFALLGRYLDKILDTGHWLLVLGFVLAAIISGLIIYRKAGTYGAEFQSLTSPKKK